MVGCFLFVGDVVLFGDGIGSVVGKLESPIYPVLTVELFQVISNLTGASGVPPPSKNSIWTLPILFPTSTRLYVFDPRKAPSFTVSPHLTSLSEFSIGSGLSCQWIVANANAVSPSLSVATTENIWAWIIDMLVAVIDWVVAVLKPPHW